MTDHLLKRAPWLLLATLLLLLAMLPHALRFYLDASQDSLVVEGDPDLELAQTLDERFGVAPFVVVTWEPTDTSLFERASLNTLAEIRTQLAQIDGVAGVTSILDVPLLRSPPVPLEEMATSVRTLEDPDTDIQLARRELTTSPLFSNLLVSKDGHTTAIQVRLRNYDRLSRLRNAREAAPDGSERNRRATLLRIAQAERSAFDDRLIEEIRTVSARLPGIHHVGGVPMIAVDLIAYVRSDLVWFGSSAVLIVTLMLWLFFRRIRWLIIPIVTSAVTIYLTVALLGALAWPVTVVSSNFLSLLLITTASLNIHLIVRHRELLREADDTTTYSQLVRETMRSKVVPCVFTTVTTMVAFSSLMTASIVPVEHFGAMMAIGVAISLVVTLALFPLLLVTFGPGAPSATLHDRQRLVEALAQLSVRHAPAMLVLALLVTAIGGWGISRLSLDNSFVDYFQDDSEIHTSLSYIDSHLGGTMPVDVVLQVEPFEPLDEDDPFASDSSDPEAYWFTPDRIAAVGRLQAIVESVPHTGKVLSLANLHAVARQLNDNRDLDALELAAVVTYAPEELRRELLAPYADPISGQLRISARVRETDPDLVHRDWLRQLDAEIAQSEFAGQTRVAGLMVLYNNMLANMFDSQLKTLGYVIGATALMFALLFRSLFTAVLALLPNVAAATAVLGIMGLLGVPLDLMTLTIAAISIGIGVDDAIHYLHRYQEERDEGSDVATAIVNTHHSVGRAMYFTSLTMVAGFSVLMLSNFYPTIYFGLFTSLAMTLALLANMTVLPALLRLTNR